MPYFSTLILPLKSSREWQGYYFWYLRKQEQDDDDEEGVRYLTREVRLSCLLHYLNKFKALEVEVYVVNSLYVLKMLFLFYRAEIKARSQTAPFQL